MSAEPRRKSETREAQTAISNARMKKRQKTAAVIGRPSGAISPYESR